MLWYKVEREATSNKNSIYPSHPDLHELPQTARIPMDFPYWATWGEVWLNLALRFPGWIPRWQQVGNKKTLPDIFLPEIHAHFNLPDKNQQFRFARLNTFEVHLSFEKIQTFRKLMFFILIHGVLSHRNPPENQNWKETSCDSFLGFHQPILWGKSVKSGSVSWFWRFGPPFLG